jgi:hypothetical protein
MNDDLTDNIEAIRKALDYASDAFEASPTSNEVEWRKEDDAMLSRARDALDALKERLGL